MCTTPSSDFAETSTGSSSSTVTCTGASALGCHFLPPALIATSYIASTLGCFCVAFAAVPPRVARRRARDPFFASLALCARVRPSFTRRLTDSSLVRRNDTSAFSGRCFPPARTATWPDVPRRLNRSVNGAADAPNAPIHEPANRTVHIQRMTLCATFLGICVPPFDTKKCVHYTKTLLAMQCCKAYIEKKTF